MKMMGKSGAVLATAAFALAVSGTHFATTSAAVAAEEAVKCSGVNSCKGTSACKTANSSCKGLNSCKGQGFVELSKAECDAQGGTVLES